MSRNDQTILQWHARIYAIIPRYDMKKEIIYE